MIALCGSILLVFGASHFFRAGKQDFSVEIMDNLAPRELLTDLRKNASRWFWIHAGLGAFYQGVGLAVLVVSQ